MNRERPDVLDKLGSPHVPGAYLQWKGTNACIDLYCSCGAHVHFDGYFLYQWTCQKCGSNYLMPSNIELIPLNDEEAAVAKERLASPMGDFSWEENE